MTAQGRVFPTEDSVPAEWLPGDLLLDLYEVRAKLGEGGMGTVYRVRHRGWGVDLAVKTPRPEALGWVGGLDAFAKEAGAWVDLGLHPHIVTCHYVRTLGRMISPQGGRVSIPRVFAELVEGGSLADWKRDGRLDAGGEDRALGRILDVAIQVVWGLAYAHERGLVHQDVKPLNVLLTQEGVAKVTDFGLARAGPAGLASSLAAGSGTMLVPHGGGYTPAYASPEQIWGRALTRRTDIFSWAVSVLEMFCGRCLWSDGPSAPAILAQYPQRGTSTGWPPMPGNLARLLAECLRHDPEDRPHDFDEVSARLQEVYRQVAGTTYPRRRPNPVEFRPDALNNRALSLLDLGRVDEAERVWERALELDPHHPESTYNQGILQWRLNDITDQTLTQRLRAAVFAEPAAWKPCYFLGLTQAERGDTVAAAEALRQAQARGGGQEVSEALQRLCPAGRESEARCLAGHTDQVKGVAVAPDCRRAVSASFDQTLRVWDLDSGECLHTLKGHTSWVLGAVITPDSRRAVSVCADKTLRVWDLGSGECLHTLEGFTGTADGVALTPDGRRAVSASGDDTLRVWDLGTGECLHTLEGPTSLAVAVAVTPDGRWAVSTSFDKALRVWDLDSGECLHTARERTAPTGKVVVTPDGRRAVSISWDGWNHMLQVWNLASGKRLRTLRGHSRKVEAVAVTPDGRRAVSASGDHTLRVWNLGSGECLHTLEGHTDEVYAVAVTPDGRRAVSAGRDWTLRVWDLDSGRCVRTFEGHTSGVRAVALTPDGRRAVSASEDHTLRVWNLTVGREEIAQWVLCQPTAAVDLAEAAAAFDALLHQARAALEAARPLDAWSIVARLRALPGYRHDPRAAALSNEVGGRWGVRRSLQGASHTRVLEGDPREESVVLAADGSRAVSKRSGYYLDGTLRVWDLGTGACLHTLEGHTSSVEMVTVTPDSRRAVSSSWDGTLRVWDLNSGECLHTLESHTSPITGVAVTPDGRRAVSASKDGALRVWDLGTGECLHTLGGFALGMHVLAVTPDGRRVISASGDHLLGDYTLRVWDLNSGECLHTLEGHTNLVNEVAVTPDGRRAVSASEDHTLRMWDLDSGECLHTLEGHTGGMYFSVAVTLDGRRAVSASWSDRTLRVWDLDSGECLHTLEGHTGGVHAVAVTPDGRRAVSASEDHTLRMWDLDSGECLHTLEGHTGGVHQVAVTPDGCRVVSESSDGTLVWDLDWDYEFPAPTHWDEAARPYLEIFLTLHSPVGPDGWPCGGKPSWSEAELQQFLVELGWCGFGWLRPEGVRARLLELAANRRVDTKG